MRRKHPIGNSFVERASRNAENIRLMNKVEEKLRAETIPAFVALNSIAEKVNALNSAAAKLSFIDSEKMSAMNKIKEVHLASEKINDFLSAKNKIKDFSELAAFKIPGIFSEINKIRSILDFAPSQNWINNTLFENYRNVSYYNLISTGFLKADGFSDFVDNEEDVEEKESKIILLDNSIRVQKLIQNVYDNNDSLHDLAPRDFEYVIAELIKDMGLEVEVTAQTRDGGCDIIAIDDKNGLTTNKYVVECKKWGKDRPVGVEVVRQFRSVIVDHGANKGIIVTSSYFSPDAEKMRLAHSHLLELKNGTHFLDWVRTYVNKTNRFKGI